MSNVTISEALAALKTADSEELDTEISIIEQEIAEFKEKILTRRRTIKEIRRLAGLPGNGVKTYHVEPHRGRPAKMTRPMGASAASTTPFPSRTPQDSGLVEKIRGFLTANPQKTTADIAEALGKNKGAVGSVLASQRGTLFEQMDDLTWKLKED
jgi:hypothetical protein